MAGEAKRTRDHAEIRRWVEERGGYPATVKRTERNGEPGLLRIDFPGYSGEATLERISWDEFFDKFDRENLEFLYQKTKDGEPSRFNKFVAAGSEQRESIERARTATAARTRKSTAGRTSKRATASTRGRKTTGSRTRAGTSTSGTAPTTTTRKRTRITSRASSKPAAAPRTKRGTAAKASSRTRAKAGGTTTRRTTSRGTRDTGALVGTFRSEPTASYPEQSRYWERSETELDTSRYEPTRYEEKGTTRSDERIDLNAEPTHVEEVIIIPESTRRTGKRRSTGRRSDSNQ